MAYEVIIKKKFDERLFKIVVYLEKEWGKAVSDAFLDKVHAKINALSDHPYIGQESTQKNIRSVFITKHNRLQYMVRKNTVVVLNMYDTRSQDAGK